MILFFRRAIPLLAPKARHRFYFACAVMMVLATMEALALALIAPLMAILLAPDFKSNSRFVVDLRNLVGHPTYARLALGLGTAVLGLYLVKCVAAVLVFRWEI